MNLWKLFNARRLNCWYGREFIEGNTCNRYFIMQINYQLNVWEETFYLFILPHGWKNLILLVALITFGFKSFKIFKWLVNRYTRTNLIWKSSVRDFCFRSSSVHHATTFSTKEVSFFVFELFQKYSASKDYFGPRGWILFFIADPASYRNINGYCFNQCESKVC